VRRRRIVLRVALVLLLVIAIVPYLLPLPPQPNVDPSALAPPGGRFVELDGTRTFLVDEGRTGAPVVLLIHGFGGSTFAWRETIPALARAGYRAVALDLPGFGLSDKTFDRDHSHPAQAAFVTGLMDLLGIERATLVGHSMGGSVAAHLALADPGRVEALVLVDAAIRGPEEAGGVSPTILLHVPPIRRIAQHVARRWATPERTLEILASAYRDPARPTAEVAEGYLAPQQLPDWDLALLAILRDGARNALPRPPDALSESGRPVLVLWGRQDSWIELEAGRALHARIPASEWIIIEDSGHLPFEEQPEDFMHALLRFLARAHQ
jgi:pimeloyl-ACP methyl ester carboxylesterase